MPGISLGNSLVQPVQRCVLIVVFKVAAVLSQQQVPCVTAYDGGSRSQTPAGVVLFVQAVLCAPPAFPPELKGPVQSRPSMNQRMEYIYAVSSRRNFGVHSFCRQS